MEIEVPHVTRSWKKNSHEHGRHDGIDKEQCGGDAGCYVVETHVERGRRHGKKDPKKGKTDGVAGPDGKVLTAKKHQNAKHQDGQPVTIEQHRSGVDAIGIKRQRAQRVGAITNGGYDSCQKSFYLITHHQCARCL